jgi:hypothetical protein
MSPFPRHSYRGACWQSAYNIRVARATLWVPLAWDALMLSQLPYVGFFFVPLEAVVASMLLRRFSGLA